MSDLNGIYQLSAFLKLNCDEYPWPIASMESLPHEQNEWEGYLVIRNDLMIVNIFLKKQPKLPLGSLPGLLGSSISPETAFQKLTSNLSYIARVLSVSDGEMRLNITYSSSNLMDYGNVTRQYKQWNSYLGLRALALDDINQQHIVVWKKLD